MEGLRKIMQGSNILSPTLCVVQNCLKLCGWQSLVMHPCWFWKLADLHPIHICLTYTYVWCIMCSSLHHTTYLHVCRLSTNRVHSWSLWVQPLDFSRRVLGHHSFVDLELTWFQQPCWSWHGWLWSSLLQSTPLQQNSNDDVHGRQYCWHVLERSDVG